MKYDNSLPDVHLRASISNQGLNVDTDVTSVNDQLQSAVKKKQEHSVQHKK